MIELNLLPKSMRKKTETVLPEIPILPISIALIVLVVIVHVVLLAVVGGKKSYLKRANSEWESVQPQWKVAQALQKKVDFTRLRVTATKNITNPDLDWAELMNGLNKAMIDDVWLSSFNMYTQKSRGGKKNEGGARILEITGFAMGKARAPSTIGKFIDSLKWQDEFNKYFSEIKLHGMREKTYAGEEVMAFKLLCSFKTSKPIVKK